MRLMILRHGPTAWSATGRLQGRRDLPLTPGGETEVRRWRLPPSSKAWRCVTSPLDRACQTARLLGYVDAICDDRLTEMDWGSFEGRTVEELRADLGDAMHRNEARGLDFRPEGGESPREVVGRVLDLLRDWSNDSRDRVVITHKGVRRAMLVIATGWDMIGKPPLRLTDDAALILELEDDATCRLGGLERLG